MAFQLALDALSTTSHRDSSLNPVLNHSVTPLQRSLDLFPWIITKDSLPFLNSCGIPVSGFGTTPHPHAVHKAIETFLLFSHWSSLASTLSSVMFMKPSKFRKLAAINPNFDELTNFRLTPADTVRYPTTSSFLPQHEIVFMHDALMYFTPHQIVDLFERCPLLNRLHCSLVVPPESSFTDLSLHPTIYTYTLNSNNLHYTPEGHHAGSYDQPRSAIRWLKLRRISSPFFNLSVTILESWGPVHSILIQRGSPVSDSLAPPHASFNVPQARVLPEATFLNQPVRHRLVPSEVYDALFTYTRAVRTLRTSDPAGFVRTHSNKPKHAWVTPQAWDNLQTYALLNAPVRPRVVYNFFLSPLQKAQLYLSQHLNPFLVRALPFLGLVLPTLKVLTRGLPAPSVSSLQIAHRVLVGPQPEPSPLAHPLVAQLILHAQRNPLFLELCQKIPVFNKFFLAACRPPSALRLELSRSMIHLPSWPLTILISLIPVVASPTLAFVLPQSIQSLHDGYHTHLHPPEFSLSWPLESFHVPARRNFLPPGMAANPPPAPLPFVSPPFPSTSASAAPLITPVNPAQSVAPPAPPALASTLEPQLPPSQPPPEPNADPSTSHSRPPAPSPCSPSASPDSPSPATHVENPTHGSCQCSDCRPEPQHLRSINEFGALNQNPTPSPSPILNQSDPKSDLPGSDLLSDPSCAGPVVEFECLFPGTYHHSNGTFLTRQRVQPSSQAPLPQKNCLLTSIAPQLGVSEAVLWSYLCEMLPDSLLDNSEIRNFGLSTDHLTALSSRLNFECVIHTGQTTLPYGCVGATNRIQITFHPGPPKHFSPNIRLSASAPGSNPSKSPLVRAALRFQLNGDFLPFLGSHKHKVSVPHAKNLISNMKNGFDGITSQLTESVGRSPKQKLLELDATIDVVFPRDVDVIHIAGFPGCGKSHPIQKLLQTKAFKHFRLSVPTNELRTEWKTDMALPESEVWRLCTWETSLFKSSNVLVIDEIYKLPRGYLDLALLADPSTSLVILLGDPLQGEYHSSHPSSSNSRLESETSRLSKYIDCYCWWTYRCPKAVADLFGVKTFNPERGFIRGELSHPQGLPNLVNSIATATTMQNLGHHALTISSSQGMTYSTPTTILLDRHSTLLSPQNCFVALTRSRKGVIFIGNMYQASGHFGTSYMFTQALTGSPVDLMCAFPLYHTLPLIFDPIRSRRHRLVAGDHPTPSVDSTALRRYGHLPPHIPVDYSKDCFVSHKVVYRDGEDRSLTTLHLPPARLPLHLQVEPSIPSEVETSSTPPCRTPITMALHGESFEELSAHFLPAHDPEVKEIAFADQRSSQFPFMDQPFELSCQPSSLLAASHRPASDPTLLVSSIKKRLRFRASESPYFITPNDMILGHHLFDSLCRAYGRDPSVVIPFDPALFAECIALNEYAQLSSKTKATIVASASRSDPDWRFTAVRIFAKAQHKVNDGSVFGSWKACQTLALMHDYVIMTLGPVKKYQRILDHNDRPRHIYTHCGKTPSQLASWCQEFACEGLSLCNDYTSFDQSQHGEAVVLECLKMRRCSIPDSLIQLHLHLKTNISTQFGPLTCMRLTGEPGTYDDNTDYNLAVIYSQYQMGSTACMVSGDDSVIFSSPPTHPSWAAVKDLLHLRFKTESTFQPLFCGYYVGPHGCCRNPYALFAKLMISTDRGNISDTLPSYLYEYSIGHRLGDACLDLVPDHLHSYLSACFDFFCRKASPLQKTLLSFDEPSPSVLKKLASSSAWASSPLLAELDDQSLQALLARSNLPSSHLDARVQRLESELLHSFQ
ncbi:polyprotein [Nemesia ring necrosis virus]|uniref:Non-structural replication polyprotein n=1 Tax=Nemesia ring necrosis virus TaxID=312009 RepID=Q3MLK9_9VIRU|nr:polyprotein [Nemesia ring necrosis virus]AAW88523.1 polyprotein [Nemesia ring necrosis virus]